MGSSIWAVLVITLAGSTKMARCGKALLVLLVSGHCVLGARQLRNNRNLPREQRNLLGTFPFNAQVAEDDHHHAHHEEHAASPRQSLESRPARQGGEDTEYDDVVQCDHSYDKRCHTTYVTNYESQQEE